MFRKVMWPITGRHRHLSAETLSEHLEGRFQGPALARLERRLAECDVCRENLEGLRATVALLKQLPAATPARSFVIAAPPSQPARTRRSPSARASMWAYAGAASVAAVLLTVLVTADATGILAPDQPTAATESATVFDEPAPLVDVAFDEPEAMAGATTESNTTIDGPPILAEAVKEAEAAFENAEAMADDGSTTELAEAFEETEVMMDAGAAFAAEPAITPDEPEVIADVAMDTDTAFEEPEAMAAAEPAAAEPADSFKETEAMADADATTEPTAATDEPDAMADAPAEFDAAPDDMEAMESDEAGAPDQSQAPEHLEPTPTAALETPAATAVSQQSPMDDDAMAGYDDDGQLEPTAEVMAEVSRSPTTVEVTSPTPDMPPADAQALAPAASTSEPAIEQPSISLGSATPEKGTALYWRILEGIAGALGLVFLAVFAFKWRASRSRRATVS